MGTARLVRNILTPNNSRSEGEEEKSTLIELAMGVQLLRTIIMDTIDPRAEDFMLVVRDNTVVFKGVTLEMSKIADKPTVKPATQHLYQDSNGQVFTLLWV